VPTLAVELNGDAVHSIRTRDRFTTTGHFSVALENLGQSTHVHLHFDDDLDRVCSVAESNHFVDGRATKRVHVTTEAVDEAAAGKLKIVTGYGSNTKYVDVAVEPPPEVPADRVPVDERFTKPPERPPDPPLGQRVTTALTGLVERGGLPAAIFGFVAIAVAVALAFAVDSVILSFVVGVVLTVSLAAAILAIA